MSAIPTNETSTAPQKPARVEITEVTSIPASMRALDNHWGNWYFKLVTNRDGKTKWTKTPSNDGARGIASTNPNNWGAFDAAMARLNSNNRLSGLGFVFNGDGYMGIDVDHCIDPISGEIDERGERFLSLFGGKTYIEYSPSRQGFHTVVRGVMPGNKRNKNPELSLEMYERDRFFTVTGLKHAMSTDEVAELQTEIGLWYAYMFPNGDTDTTNKSGGFDSAEIEDLVVDLSVEMSASLKRRLQSDLKIWATFCGKRDDLKDKTASERDLSLADLMAKSDDIFTNERLFTNQDIVDAMIISRRLLGDGPKYPGYYVHRTLAKALAWATAERANGEETATENSTTNEASDMATALPDAPTASTEPNNVILMNQLAFAPEDAIPVNPKAKAKKAGGKQKDSQVDRINRIACDNTEFFTTSTGAVYARVHLSDGRTFVMPFGDDTFKDYLSARLREAGEIAAINALNTVIDGLERDARNAATTRGVQTEEVFTRVAYDESTNRIYLNLCNTDHEFVEITETGWQIVANPPRNMNFIRVTGMEPLPHPVCGGSMDELRPFVNVKNDDDFMLIKGWLLGVFQPYGGHAFLGFSGAAGSAKSTTNRNVLDLVDPNAAPSREPRDPRDVTVYANQACVMWYENLSRIETWFSDILCSLATGSGDRSREFYSQRKEVIFKFQRHVIFNGIPSLARRSDLAQRVIEIETPFIPKSQRKTERKLNQAYQKARPRILGALLDAVSVALRRHLTTEVPDLPRLADFVQWVSCAEDALNIPSGRFIQLFDENQETTSATVMEDLPLARGLVWLVTHLEFIRSGGQAMLEERREDDPKYEPGMQPIYRVVGAEALKQLADGWNRAFNGDAPAMAMSDDLRDIGTQLNHAKVPLFTLYGIEVKVKRLNSGNAYYIHWNPDIVMPLVDDTDARDNERYGGEHTVAKDHARKYECQASKQARYLEDWNKLDR